MALPSVDQTFERVKLVGAAPETSGAPTDTPDVTNGYPYRFDPVANRLYVFNGTSWVSVVLA